MIDDDVDQELRAVLSRALAEQKLSLSDDPAQAIRRRIDHRQERRRRGARATLAAAAVAVLVSSAVIVVAQRDGGDGQQVDAVAPSTTAVAGSDPTMPIPAPAVPPASTGAVLPDLVGLTLADAKELAASQGFEADPVTFEDGRPPSDPDFPFAVVIAQKPPAGQTLPAPESPNEYLNRIGLRTMLPQPPDENICAASDHRVATTAEGLPWEGSTNRAAVDGFMQTRSVAEMSSYLRRSLVGMWPGVRDGLVWRQPTDEIVDGTPDYWIIAEVADVSQCPDSPHFANGLPIQVTHGWPMAANSDTAPVPTISSTPRLSIEPAGPYADGQDVIVHGSGFDPGKLEGGIGECPAGDDTARYERCGRWDVDNPVTVGPDGTFSAPFRLFAATPFGVDCRAAPGCVLAWVPPRKSMVAALPLEFTP